MQEMQVQSLDREDPLEEGMATHSSILAENPMDRAAWCAMVNEVTRVGRNLVTKQSPPILKIEINSLEQKS